MARNLQKQAVAESEETVAGLVWHAGFDRHFCQVCVKNLLAVWISGVLGRDWRWQKRCGGWLWDSLLRASSGLHQQRVF